MGFPYVLHEVNTEISNHLSQVINPLTLTYILLDLSQIGSSSLRGNGNNLSPRILDLRGGGRRKSGFNFGD